MLADGEAASEIAKKLGVHRSTVYGWAERYGGHWWKHIVRYRLMKKIQPGRPRTLDKIAERLTTHKNVEQLITQLMEEKPSKISSQTTDEKLHEKLSKASFWTVPLLLEYLKTEEILEDKISHHTIWRTLKRLGYHWTGYGWVRLLKEHREQFRDKKLDKEVLRTFQRNRRKKTLKKLLHKRHEE